MAKTLLQIRDLVRSYLDEPSANAADWTDTELNVLINSYYHRVYSSVIDVFEDYSPLSVSTSDTVAGQQEYSLPTDFLKVRRAEINYDISNSGSTFAKALPVTMDAVRKDLANENTLLTIKRGAVYYLRANVIGFIPIPDKAGDEAIKLWYYPLQSDLTADSDTIDLPYADRDFLLIVWGAASEALRFGQQETEEADKLDRKYERGLLKMTEYLENRTADDYKGVIDIQGDHVDFGGY